MNKILEISKDFFACGIVLAANQQLPGNIQRLFRLQNCRICKPRKSWKYPKIFSTAELFQPQINNILEFFEDFFACRVVLAANQQYPGNIQRFFRLQNCLSRKSTKSWNYSKTFPPQELSQPQINKILEVFKNFFACRIVLAANQQNPGNSQRFFRLQSCFSRKSTISWKYPKIFLTAELSEPQINKMLEVFKNFFACRIVLAANQQYPGISQRFFRLQSCFSRKSTKSWKYPKIFSTAELSQPQINKILELFKDFSASRIVLDPNQQNPGNIHSFFACRIVLAASQQYPGKIQRVFHLQNCLSRKSTKSWNYSKTFPPQELCQPQINKILEVFKNFFACRVVLATYQQYPGISQRFFRLQSCFSRKSTISWKYPKFFSTAELSQPQINKILELFKDFSASRIVLDPNQQNPGNIHSFFACRIVLAANQQYPGNIQRFF